jgi:hypothetical protein
MGRGVCFGSTVRSLIKLNATVTSRLPAGTAIKQLSWFYCFYVRSLTPVGKNLVALGGELCSSRWEPASDSCFQLYQWTRCIFMMLNNKDPVACLYILAKLQCTKPLVLHTVTISFVVIDKYKQNVKGECYVKSCCSCNSVQQQNYDTTWLNFI